MDASLFRAAFNPTIAEAHDACHGLHDARTGAMLVQGTSGVTVFVGVMAPWPATCSSSTIPISAARTCRTSG